MTAKKHVVPPPKKKSYTSFQKAEWDGTKVPRPIVPPGTKRQNNGNNARS
jgi:hypothetical protein